jgi:agmatine deiminase
MIIDSETNFLYLSEVLKSRHEFFTNLISLLVENRITYKLLPETKDIWAVDYMPIQTGIDRFIQFKYEPDYLKDDEFILTQTDPLAVCAKIGLQVIESNIKIDGGNVIKGKNWVILTDKIFKENSNFSKNQLLRELEKLFGVEILIIPQEPNDFTGHADGIVRYYTDDTVIVNRYNPKDNEGFQKRLKTALKSHGLKTIEIPYNPYQNSSIDSADGLYINYLQMENFILLPTFNKKDDEIAFRQFEQLFPGHTIKTIDSRQISKDGGVLNCITWNTKSVLS